MLKTELIQRIHSQNPHLYERDVEKLVNVILGEIVQAMGRADRVELRGFGTFSGKVRQAHKGRNPKTGVEVEVPPKIIPFFKTGKEMRARLNPATDPISASADQVAKEVNLSSEPQ
jgi:integration host factor subunit beta